MLCLQCACSSPERGDSTGPSAAGAATPSGAAGQTSASGSTGGALGSAGTGGAADHGGTAGNGGSAVQPPGPTSNVSVTSRFPHSAASVCADAPLRLSFSGAVKVGAVGQIRLFKSAEPTTPLDSIDLAAPSIRDLVGGRSFVKVLPVFIEGDSAVIYFKTKALAQPGSYFVTMDAGVFVDESRSALPAITGPDGWQFDTVAPSPADPTRLTVSREGGGDFCTVQGAVDFVPAANMVPTTITIQSGVYHEIVYVNAKHNLTFHGEDRKQTRIVYPNNDALQLKRGTAFRALFEVESSNGLVLENLTLHNSTPQGGTQAEALRIEPGDKAILRDADLISRQDTLLLTGRVYVKSSYIEGNVDFIWGKGSAYFEGSEIKTVGRAGYLVQARNGANYGYVFVDSTLSGEATPDGATVLARIEGDRFPTSNVAYVNCKLGPHIASKGWLISNSTGASVESLDLSKLKFWEYQSTDLDGTLLDVSMRDPASRQLSELEAATLRDKASVLAGWAP